MKNFNTQGLGFLRIVQNHIIICISEVNFTLFPVLYNHPFWFVFPLEKKNHVYTQKTL